MCPLVTWASDGEALHCGRVGLWRVAIDLSRSVELFNHPTVEDIYMLSPTEFEHFVAYVLRRAGYDAKVVGPHFLRGVDIEIRLPGRARIIGGVECKRFASDQLVKARVVSGARGAQAVARPSA